MKPAILFLAAIYEALPLGEETAISKEELIRRIKADPVAPLFSMDQFHIAASYLIEMKVLGCHFRKGYWRIK